jgi:hypothetical protein
MVYIVILILIIVFVIICWCDNDKMSEGMKVVGKPMQDNGVADNTQKFKGTFTNFNGRMAIDDQYFYDKLFDDVVYYDNKYDRDTGDLISTGWQECKMACPNACIEYGVTGSTYCFPY